MVLIIDVGGWQISRVNIKMPYESCYSRGRDASKPAEPENVA